VLYPPTSDTVKQAKELLARGINQYKAQQYSRALANLEKARNLNPKEAVLYSYLGLTYAGLNRLQEAIEAYRQALNLS